MDEEEDEEKRLWYEGRTVGALFVHVFVAAAPPDEDVRCGGDRCCCSHDAADASDKEFPGAALVPHVGRSAVAIVVVGVAFDWHDDDEAAGCWKA